MTTTDLPRADAAPAPHLPGTPEYRRVMVAVFAAGMATFVLLYDVPGRCGRGAASARGRSVVAT